MRILIVYAHHEPTSFNGAMLDVAIGGGDDRVGRGPVDHDVVGYRGRQLAVGGVDDGALPGVQQRVVAVAEVDPEVLDVALNRVVAVAEVDLLPGGRAGALKDDGDVPGIGLEDVEILEFSLVAYDLVIFESDPFS